MDACWPRVGLLTVMYLAACVVLAPHPAWAQEDIIKVGMTNSFSGALAQAATPVWRGVMVWQDWVNDQGGILVKDQGKKLKVKVVYYDDETSRENLIRLYDKLASGDKVDFFLAPFGSGQTFVVAGLADKYKRLMITTTGGSPSIYTQGYRYLIQGISQVNEFARAYVDLLHRVDPENKRLAIVYEDHLLPKSAATLVKDQAEKMGYKFVFFDKFPFGAQDIAPVLTRVKQIKPDHIYLMANLEGTILGLRQMADLKVNARSIGILDNGMYYFRKTLGGKLLDGIMGPVEWDMSQRYKNITMGPDNDQFSQYHKKRFPNDEFDNHTPMGTNAGLILQRAIETAGTLDSQKVRAAFCSMRVTTLIGPQAWECDTGLMKLAADGGMPTIVTQWREDGSTVTIWPPEFGDLGKLRFPVNKF